MPEKELETKNVKPATKHPATKHSPTSSKSPTVDQLSIMTTDQLVKMLSSPDMGKSEKTTVRQQIIKLLQERKGNSFVQSLLGAKTSSPK